MRYDSCLTSLHYWKIYFGPIMYVQIYLNWIDLLPTRSHRKSSLQFLADLRPLKNWNISKMVFKRLQTKSGILIQDSSFWRFNKTSISIHDFMKMGVLGAFLSFLRFLFFLRFSKEERRGAGHIIYGSYLIIC